MRENGKKKRGKGEEERGEEGNGASISARTTKGGGKAMRGGEKDAKEDVQPDVNC